MSNLQPNGFATTREFGLSSPQEALHLLQEVLAGME